MDCGVMRSAIAHRAKINAEKNTGIGMEIERLRLKMRSPTNCHEERERMPSQRASPILPDSYGVGASHRARTAAPSISVDRARFNTRRSL